MVGQKDFYALSAALVPVEEEYRADQLWNNFLFYYHDLDPESQKKISLLFKVIKVLSLLLMRRGLQNLDMGERTEFFHKLQNFRVKKIAVGFTGLRSLIFIAYYTLEPVWQELGYKGPLVKREL